MSGESESKQAICQISVAPVMVLVMDYLPLNMLVFNLLSWDFCRDSGGLGNNHSSNIREFRVQRLKGYTARP